MEGESSSSALALEEVTSSLCDLNVERIKPEDLDRINWDTFSERLSNSDLVLVDIRLRAIVNKVSSIKSKINFLFFSTTPVTHQHLEGNQELRELVASYKFMDLSVVQGSNIARILQIILNPGKTPGLLGSVSKNSEVVVEKLQEATDICWTLDTIIFYWKTKFEIDPLSIMNFRSSAITLLQEGLYRCEQMNANNPTVCFQCFASKKVLFFSVKFSSAGIAAEAIQDQAIQNPRSNWAILVSKCDSLIITKQKEADEIEIKILINVQEGMDPEKISSIFSCENNSADNSSKYLYPPEIIKPIRLEQILLGLPRNHLRALSSLFKSSANATKEEKDSVYGRLAIKQTGLLNQMNERILQEQSRFEEKNQRNMKLLHQAKIELQETKKSQLQYKNKLKNLERENKNLADSNSSTDDVDYKKKLHESKNKLKIAQAEKNKAEEKLKNIETKVDILEKKITALIEEKNQKEKELNDTKPLLLKLGKELQSAQQTIKAQQASATVPVNAGADNSKIKILSEKLIETQKKEQEAQLALKKTTLKLEQVENSLKQMKTQEGGKEKQLERQLEAFKLKEKDLLKKISELQDALKKMKAGKAA